MRDTTTEAMQDWIVAAEDAEIDPDAVRLFEARSPHGRMGAVHYGIGMWATPEDTSFVFSQAHSQRLFDLRDEHVIVLDETVQRPRQCSSFGMRPSTCPKT